ncbi:MAG: VWA domain-containing protein [Bryobacteraceae bacterium]
MFEGSGREPSIDRALRLAPGAGPFFFVFFASVALSQDRPLFTAEANLQSIAVEVTDHHGDDVRGLTAADFTLLEDGQPQNISFFGAEEQPISLAVLVDSSASMESGDKLERVRETLPPLLRGNLPGDEIYFGQFTDRVFPLQTLTGQQRLHTPIQEVNSLEGTAFYDALASALCTLRGARNLRQAVVAITDGADQHSRLTLDQLIQTARSSRPQIFTIGYFDDREAGIFRNSGKVVTLVNSHDIDNPLKAFERISKETGAESFLPADERDLKKALARILGVLRAQYTLAYYTGRPGAFRRIEVKVNRSGAVVSTRRAVGSETGDDGLAHFSATGCEVSPSRHPYPWEPHLSKTPDGLTIYRDDFSDPRSGWPTHPGFRYAEGAYEISVPAIAGNGPSFAGFRASVKIEPQSGEAGLVFRLNERGCYLLLVQWRHMASHLRQETVRYKLVKKFWSGPTYEPIVPWTEFPRLVGQQIPTAVECVGNRITVRIDGIQAIRVTDDAFPDGQAGMAVSGFGCALFRDFQVERLK